MVGSLTDNTLQPCLSNSSRVFRNSRKPRPIRSIFQTTTSVTRPARTSDMSARPFGRYGRGIVPETPSSAYSLSSWSLHYGMRMFLFLAGILIAAGYVIAVYFAETFSLGAWIGGLFLFIFAWIGRSIATGEATTQAT